MKNLIPSRKYSASLWLAQGNAASGTHALLRYRFNAVTLQSFNEE
jgi:hypothetical protein